MGAHNNDGAARKLRRLIAKLGGVRLGVRGEADHMVIGIWAGPAKIGEAMVGNVMLGNIARQMEEARAERDKAMAATVGVEPG